MERNEIVGKEKRGIDGEREGGQEEGNRREEGKEREERKGRNGRSKRRASIVVTMEVDTVPEVDQKISLWVLLGNLLRCGLIAVTTMDRQLSDCVYRSAYSSVCPATWLRFFQEPCSSLYLGTNKIH